MHKMLLNTNHCFNCSCTSVAFAAFLLLLSHCGCRCCRGCPAGVCAQIMGLPTEWYAGFLPQQAQQQEAGGAGTSSIGPDNAHANAAAPVLFVHMPRDKHTTALVAEDVKLRQGRVSSSRTLLCLTVANTCHVCRLHE
jgi:hypothetical protein